MAYYKFNPKNHLCSLTWTGFLLLTSFTGGRFIKGLVTTGLFGVPTVVMGINKREELQKQRANIIVTHIHQQGQVTIPQASNILQITGEETRDLLNTLYKDDRIEMTNREEDGAIVYIPPDNLLKGN